MYFNNYGFRINVYIIFTPHTTHDCCCSRHTPQ